MLSPSSKFQRYQHALKPGMILSEDSTTMASQIGSQASKYINQTGLNKVQTSHRLGQQSNVNTFSDISSMDDHSP